MHSARVLPPSWGAPEREESPREALPRDLAELVPAAVYTARAGASGGWLYASPQIEVLVGYTAQEFLDDPGLWARLLHPDDRGWVLAEEDADALVREVQRSHAEYRMIARDGRVVWVLDDMTLVNDPEQGAVEHGVLFDITHRKQVELRLAEQSLILERIARGSTLEDTFTAILEAIVRVTGATTCAASMREGRTYVAGARSLDRRLPVERAPFHGTDGALLGELLVLDVGAAPEVRHPDGALRLEWAQRLASLAVERAHQAEREARSYSVLAATLEATADGILVVDSHERIVTSNQKFWEMWQIPQDLIAEKDQGAIMECVVSQFADREAAVADITALTADPELVRVDELVFTDGRIFERLSQPQMLAGRPIGRVWSFRDVTDMRRLQENLKHEAYTDSLTGLPNRHGFMQRLNGLLPDDAPAGWVAQDVALLLIDVDDFKTVNDGLGHLAGDAMLVALAERVTQRVPRRAMAARLGGDEFAVLVRCPDGVNDVRRLAEQIMDSLESPVDVDGRMLSIRTSVGIALSDGSTPARDLVRNADLAMYTAKRAGGAAYRLYCPDMHEVAIARLDLKADLGRAIDNDGLSVAYQPVVDLVSGEVTGFEALARWNHLRLGTISPAEFIPLAEETGLIGRLGQWVLSRVCSDIAGWQAELDDPVPTVSVNLSPRQLSEPGIADQVAGVIEDNGLRPGSICLEITETALGEADTNVTNALIDIHALGIQLSLDDFGTGHSSLSRLGSYPFDVIKVDRSFVTPLTSGARHRAVVEAVLTLAEAFSLEVIAEGVETEGQREVLAGLGCERVQGFLFSRPIPASDAFELLRAGRTLG